MSRWARRVDSNQPTVVEALRKLGAFVEPKLSRVGEGCPDLLMGWRSRWYLVEVKDGSLAPSKRMLTPAEADWHHAARALGLPVFTIESVDEAVQLLTKEVP